MKVDDATSEDIFDYLFDGWESLIRKRKRSIFLNYLRNGTRSIFN